MQETTRLRHNHHEQIQAHDAGIPREDERILATVPSQIRAERYAGDGPSPETYRRALKTLLATPEIESRLDYITASLIVTIFGGWLASKVVVSRAFTFCVDLMLFVESLALAGLLIGVMLGENILPAGTAMVLLFVAMDIVLLIVGFVLGSMIVAATANSRKRRDEIFSRRGVVVSPGEPQPMMRTRAGGYASRA